MKILCWNVWGLGNPRTFRTLRSLLRKENSELVFLSETRLEKGSMDRIWCSFGFEGCFGVDRDGLGGGLLLLWRDKIDITIHSYSKGHIDSTVVDEEGTSWRFTGFYGEPNQNLRLHSWELLRRLKSLSGLPWLVGGDFNEILRDEEKSGGKGRSSRLMSQFKNVIDDCNLLDLGFNGHPFTWVNRQGGDKLVKERIDRLLYCLKWRALFPEARVMHLNFEGSDHLPILVERAKLKILEKGERSGNPDSILRKLGLRRRTART
ncbi:hypothetical protein ACOSQ2_010649 [Xanthoceras sorbifolium]